MNKIFKNSTIMVITGVVVTCCFCFLVANTIKQQNLISKLSDTLQGYFVYLDKSFINPINDSDKIIFDYMYQFNRPKLSVYIPTSACGACAINLIQTIYNNRYENNDVEFFFDKINVQVLNEIKIYGYRNYHIVNTVDYEDAINMLILKREDGRPILYLKYYEENPYILNLFFQ